VRNVAPAPASAPAMNVSTASVSRFCKRATSFIIDRVCVNINRFNPENGASRAMVLPSPENNPAAPSLLLTLASVATKPFVAPPLAPAYSIRVFTTVIGFKSTAATVLADAPAENVMSDRSTGPASARPSVAASSFVTRSKRQKYIPAPSPVRTMDAETPDHNPRAPLVRMTSFATRTIPRAPRRRSACIFVFTTSNGCNTAAETNPAEAPPRKLANALVDDFTSCFTAREPSTAPMRGARPPPSADDDVTRSRSTRSSMPPIAHEGAVRLWKERKDVQAWREHLDAYEERLRALNRGERCVQLDAMVRSDLPKNVAERGYITAREYCDVVEWKLARGKHRPALMNYARAISEEAVRKASTDAFERAAEAKVSVGDAMAPLIALKGCGPATASAIMVLADERYPFFSDEALCVVIGNGKSDSDRYSMPRYKEFMNALQRRCDELGAPDLTPAKLERALWSAAALTIPKKASKK